MIQILFALLAGVLTIGAPCVLPLLPILLGTSVGQHSKSRPIYIVLGFVLVFAVLGVGLSFLTSHLGLSANVLRNVAIGLLAVFGLLLVWKRPFEWVAMHVNGWMNLGGNLVRQPGNGSAFVLGMTLGIVWTPCAGPVLGTILTLVATQNNLAKSLLLLAAYAVGAGIPMLAIAYGSQMLTTKVRAIAKYAAGLQQVFGVLIMLLAVVMYFQWDVQIENKLSGLFPQQNLEAKLTQTNSPTPNMETIELHNYGPAPEFAGISHWLNSNPLTIQSLRGKVVLVDFWTFSCINCIRTLPHVTKWYDTYKDQGLVVVGVHTPEFEFEKDTANVQTAITRHQIHYPVAQDNDFATWNAYNNQYWPAEYLIDKNGNVVYVHFGEGEYDHTEDAIRTLLGMSGNLPADNGQDLSKVGSPEMYFGTNRLQNLTLQQYPSQQNFTMPTNLDLNTFALAGTWQFSAESAQLLQPAGKIRLKFHAGKVHMVAESTKPQTLKILVDGKLEPEVRVSGSELYTLFDSEEYTDHVIEITIPDSGFQAFTFTFG